MTSILSAIGRTPLIPLQRLASGLSARILAKVESLNPGGSIKDRVGVAMVEEAERRGWLRPGGTIIEATAGQYRGRAGAGGRGQGLSVHLRAAGQDERREDPAAEGLWRRDRDHADLGRRPTRPRAITAWPTGWPARSPAAGGPTSSPTSPIPRSIIDRPAPRSGSRPAARSRLRRGRGDRRHDLRRGPIPQGAQSRCQDHRRRPGGLGPLGRCSPARGRSRGSARTSCRRRSTARSWTSGFASATPRASARPATWPGARVCSWAARPARPWPRRCGMPGGSRPTTWSSSCAPTPAATT